jgi:hypothetical protein
METLDGEYEKQQRRKGNLENDLDLYQKELEDIENSYPRQVENLKNQIQDTRRQTEEYDKKNEQLNIELRALRAKKNLIKT